MIAGSHLVLYCKATQHFLTVRENGGYHLPGGKALPGETMGDCLLRELGEECSKEAVDFVRSLTRKGELTILQRNATDTYFFFAVIPESQRSEVFKLTMDDINPVFSGNQPVATSSYNVLHEVSIAEVAQFKMLGFKAMPRGNLVPHHQYLAHCLASLYFNAPWRS